MIPRFALVRPSSVGEALAAYAEAGGDAAWYAGGTELLQVMKMGLARFGTLIDLKRLPELRGVALDGDSLAIGAATTHRELERSDLVRHELPALAGLEARVANVRVRNQGTLGGNLAFAEPHSDPATFLLACDAHVVLRGRGGERELPLDAFLVGPFATARLDDEILVAIRVPRAERGEGRAYEKAKFRERPAVSVAVRLRIAEGTIAAADVVVGSMVDVPTRVPPAAAALVRADADPSALDGPLADAPDSVALLDAVDDLDGSADYKRHLAGVLLRRAARAALAEAVADA